MRKLLLLVFVLFGGLFRLAEAQAQTTFSAVNADGVTFNYTVIDAVNKYVKLTGGSGYTSAMSVLRVPGLVSDGVNTYVVRTFGYRAFDTIDKHGTIVFSDSIRVIEGGGIWYNSIDSVHFPAKLEAIVNPDYWSQTTAFIGLDVPSYTLPSTLKNLGGYTFAREMNGVLKRIYGLENTQIDSVENAFYELSGLESISLPSTLKGAGGQFLTRMSKLKEIILPEGMRTINQAGSSSCLSENPVLEKMTIPSTMKWMLLNWGLRSNPMLKRVNVNAVTPPAFPYQTGYASKPFDAHADLEIYVPVDCSKAYMTSSYAGWSHADNQTRYREQIPTASSGYRSFYLENENFEVPTGYTAYIVTGASKSATWTDGDPWDATLTSFPAGSIIPAQTACILWSGSAGAKTMEYKANVSGTPVTISGNLLVGTATDASIVANAGEKLFVFSGSGPQGAGFYHQTAYTDGSQIDLKAHQAGLKLATTSAPAPGLRIDFSKAVPYVPTGVTRLEVEVTKTDNTVYDLSGRRVNGTHKGVYIQNGKKILR